MESLLVDLFDLEFFVFGLYCFGKNFDEILLLLELLMLCIPFWFGRLLPLEGKAGEEWLPLVELLLLLLLLLLMLVLLWVPFSTFEPLTSFAFNSGVFGDDLLLCLTLFLDLMTSLFKEIGLGRPCSFKNKPQALHKTWPVSSLLHNGVVWVLQFLHVGVDMFCFVVVEPFDCVVVVVLALGTMWSKSFLEPSSLEELLS